MGTLNRECPRCGSESSPEGDETRAFVHYDPSPNDAQQELEWADDLPTLHALVCRECSYVIGVVDAEDPERAEERRNQFRVDEELR